MQKALRVTPFHSNQIIYNLFDRQIEVEELPFCERQGIGILTHSSLAKGLLTGRYTPDHKFPADDERSEFPGFQGETFVRYLALADQLKQVAQAKGLSLIQLAIAWLLRWPAVACVLVGAKTPAQVAAYGGAVGVVFNREELRRIDEILLNIPQPTTGV